MSAETMKKDFERLAKQRVERVVDDVLDLHKIARLDPNEAVQSILSVLFWVAANVMAEAGMLPSRDDLYTLIDSLLRSARRGRVRDNHR